MSDILVRMDRKKYSGTIKRIMPTSCNLLPKYCRFSEPITQKEQVFSIRFNTVKFYFDILTDPEKRGARDALQNVTGLSADQLARPDIISELKLLKSDSVLLCDWFVLFVQQVSPASCRELNAANIDYSIESHFSALRNRFMKGAFIFHYYDQRLSSIVRGDNFEGLFRTFSIPSSGYANVNFNLLAIQNTVTVEGKVYTTSYGMDDLQHSSTKISEVFLFRVKGDDLAGTKTSLFRELLISWDNDLLGKTLSLTFESLSDSRFPARDVLMSYVLLFTDGNYIMMLRTVKLDFHSVITNVVQRMIKDPHFSELKFNSDATIYNRDLAFYMMPFEATTGIMFYMNFILKVARNIESVTMCTLSHAVFTPINFKTLLHAYSLIDFEVLHVARVGMMILMMYSHIINYRSLALPEPANSDNLVEVMKRRYELISSCELVTAFNRARVGEKPSLLEILCDWAQSVYFERDSSGRLISFWR